MTAAGDETRARGEHRLCVCVLTDIALVAATAVYDPSFVWEAPWKDGYGELYGRWLGRRKDECLRRNVTALASAAATALTHKDGQALFQTAKQYGLPLAETLANDIARHFRERREAVLTYRR